jgi:glutamate formiminotransferase
MTADEALAECVINVSEGRDQSFLSGLRHAAGPILLDLHADPDHHRSVLTLGGEWDAVERAARAIAVRAVAALDLQAHEGAHPRIGVLDVIPWVALAGWPVRDGPLSAAVAARDRFAAWAGAELGLPCFLYGPERSLPDVRRLAWKSLAPATGPTEVHPGAGAAAVGARPILVAYNLWLAGEGDPPHREAGVRAEAGSGDVRLEEARRIAAAIRGPGIRALGLRVGSHVQVSCNLTDPWHVGPAAAFDAVASRTAVARAELVGLIPLSVLEQAPRRRWKELGLDPSTTIEARLERAGLNGGRFTAQGAGKG